MIVKKIKRWLRKKYIIYRYTHNYNSDKVIYLNPTDRQLGLTTMIIKDAIKYNVPILVPTFSEKNRVCHEMYKMGQLGLGDSITEESAKNNLVIALFEDLREGKITKILVDNRCSEWDLETFILKNPVRIVNGFVTKQWGR